MPCWYYEKRDLRNTPSQRDGIDADTEARYRREGARFILDTGSQMGLRYDTCATGVVYFHRFYMFHSFREFHRYVTAACCLFLAGKVEETPKKCKDIINTTRSMLTKQQFQVFGDDPKEEVMTLERILLQTIRFDLMVEHPYAYLLKFAKQLKGQDNNDSDKGKIQKMVQMAWTFINDSLCTNLCLLWEADVISVALMYLASRLTKFDIQEWYCRQTGQRGLKWWDKLVEDVSLELLEDICHQVLDLYSQGQQKSKEESPPPPPPPRPTSSQAGHKRSRASTPSESRKDVHHNSSAMRRPDLSQRLADEMGQGPPPAKQSRTDTHQPKSKSPSPVPKREHSTDKGERRERDRDRERERERSQRRHKAASQPPSHHASPVPPHTQTQPPPVTQPPQTQGAPYPTQHPPPGHPPPHTDEGYTSYNPYISSQMYSSSFMNQEGSQSIQSLIGGGGAGGVAPQGPPPTTYGDYQPPSHYNQAGPPPPGQYAAQPGYQQPPPVYKHNQPPSYQQPPPGYPSQPYPQAQPQHPTQAQPYTQQPPPGTNFTSAPYPVATSTPAPQPYSQPPPETRGQYNPGFNFQHPPPTHVAPPRHTGPQSQQQQSGNPGPGLPTIRITGRR